MNLRYALTSFLMFPLCAFASICGIYEVHGYDPQDNHEYAGSVSITKDDEVYSVIWTFENNNTDTGTGVRKGDTLSIVFLEDNSTSYGTQLYKVYGSTLSGPWVRFGGTEEGSETLKRIHCSD